MGCEIIVNGRSMVVGGGDMTYERIVELAHGLGRSAGFIWTVTWSYKNAGGILSKGQSVDLQSGMVFNVCDTSNA